MVLLSGKSTSASIVLPFFLAHCKELLDTGQLFKGHPKFENVYDARNQLSIRDCVLCYVSGHELKSLVAPLSLKHLAKLDPGHLSKGKKALPTMTIATIKYDDHNRPKRAKYCLVVLGNLDYHTWSKKATADPVLSQLELHLFTSLVVYRKRVLKNCDVKQAFIQSSLPANEEYFL
jgi:hypothetical protein